MEEFIKKHGTPEEFAIAIIKAIPEISIDEAVEAIRGYHKDLKAIQMQAGVKPEIARMDMHIKNVEDYSILTKKLHINNKVPDDEIWVVYDGGKLEKFKI